MGLDVRTSILANGAAFTNADSLVDRRSDALFASEISLCGLNRNVTKQELDLFQFTSGSLAQPRACPPQVMRRKLVDSSLRWELTDHVPDDLFSHAVTPNPAGPIHPTKQPARGNSRAIQPNVSNLLDPGPASAPSASDRPSTSRFASNSAVP